MAGLMICMHVNYTNLSLCYYGMVIRVIKLYVKKRINGVALAKRGKGYSISELSYG